MLNRIAQEGIYENHDVYHRFKDESESLSLDEDIERFLSENCWHMSLQTSINEICFQLYFFSSMEEFHMNACLDSVIFKPRSELYENYKLFESAVRLFFEFFELKSCQKLYSHTEGSDLAKIQPTLIK